MAHRMPVMQAFGHANVSANPAFSVSFPLPDADALPQRYSSVPANASCSILIAVAFSSVNPSDIHPTVAASDQFPKALGSDVAGVVVGISNTGPRCKRLKVGDKVWGDIGANTHTPSGDATKELGGYAQYAAAFEAQLSRVPQNLGLAEAGALPKVALTSYKALTWFAGLPTRSPGTAVLILGGSSGTGSVGIQLGKKAWNATITTTTSAPNIPYVRSLGADEVIDYHAQNWWEVLPDSSLDIVYDCVGQHETGNRAVRKLRPGGVYVTITGALATPPLPPGVKQFFFINSDTNLVGSAPLLEDLAQLAERGVVRTHIDGTFGLEEIPTAFAKSKEGHVVGKLSVRIDQKAGVSGAALWRAGWQRQ